MLFFNEARLAMREQGVIIELSEKIGGKEVSEKVMINS